MIFTQMKEYNTALNFCEELDEIIPACYKENVNFLRMLLNQYLTEKQLIQFAANVNNDNNYFEVFCSENRLCSIFPSIPIKLDNIQRLV